MKNEHEMLKEICDKIGYGYPYAWPEMWYLFYFDTRKDYNSFMRYDWKLQIDVREIIFTPEFMGKFKIHHQSMLENKWLSRSFAYSDTNMIWINIMNNLDNPTQYLYNLIK